MKNALEQLLESSEKFARLLQQLNAKSYIWALLNNFKKPISLNKKRKTSKMGDGTNLEAASLIMKAFLGEVKEIRAAEVTDDDDIVSSDGPAPRERS